MLSENEYPRLFRPEPGLPDIINYAKILVRVTQGRTIKDFVSLAGASENQTAEVAMVVADAMRVVEWIRPGSQTKHQREFRKLMDGISNLVDQLEEKIERYPELRRQAFPFSQYEKNYSDDFVKPRARKLAAHVAKTEPSENEVLLSELLFVPGANIEGLREMLAWHQANFKPVSGRKPKPHIPYMMYRLVLGWTLIHLQKGVNFGNAVPTSRNGGLRWCIEVATWVLGPDDAKEQSLKRNVAMERAKLKSQAANVCSTIGNDDPDSLGWSSLLGLAIAYEFIPFVNNDELLETHPVGKEFVRWHKVHYEIMPGSYWVD